MILRLKSYLIGSDLDLNYMGYKAQKHHEIADITRSQRIVVDEAHRLCGSRAHNFSVDVDEVWSWTSTWSSLVWAWQPGFNYEKIIGIGSVIQIKVVISALFCGMKNRALGGVRADHFIPREQVHNGNGIYWPIPLLAQMPLPNKHQRRPDCLDLRFPGQVYDEVSGLHYNYFLRLGWIGGFRLMGMSQVNLLIWLILLVFCLREPQNVYVTSWGHVILFLIAHCSLQLQNGNEVGGVIQ